MERVTAQNAEPGVCKPWTQSLIIAILIGMTFSGCGGTTCITFVSNPGGTVNVPASNPLPGCMAQKVFGAVRVEIRSGLGCSEPSGSHCVQHAFLSLRGVDISEDGNSNNPGSAWQPLTPQLESQPVRWDLLTTTGNPATVLALGENATVPAGVYRQIRLRFAQSGTFEDAPPGEFACGALERNCVVTRDGRPHPLAFDSGEPQLVVHSGRIDNGLVVIPPEARIKLTIELNVAWSALVSDGRNLQLVPVLAGRASAEPQ